MTNEEMQLKMTKYDLLFESRLTKVETSLDHLDKTMDDLKKEVKDGFTDVRSDFKWIFKMMLGFSAILLAVMSKGFHWY